MRVTHGAALDVAVDLRRSSPTFAKHVAVELTGENGQMLWIPEGFGHAFLALTDDVGFAYKVTDYYCPAGERTIRMERPGSCEFLGLLPPSTPSSPRRTAGRDTARSGGLCMSSLPRILLVGYAGQVGVELRRSFSDAGEIICHDRDTVDMAVPEQVRAMVRGVAPDTILNAAAYTAVDRAESELEAAMAVNARAPAILAEEALRTGALLVHYSTDYVFDGSKPGPWVETDQTESAECLWC